VTVHCEWGLQGVKWLAPQSDAVVIVDVLSFSTAVDIAAARGAAILPYRWKDGGKDAAAEAYGHSKGAVLAGSRGASGGYSLSPASLETIQPGEALVLPSPNGSTLSLAAAETTPTYCACLRNARAVAAHLGSAGFQRIAVVAAGEQWDDGSLRPCVEDLVGAGAVIAELRGTLSPEAEAAEAVFERFRNRLYEAIRESVSGRELAERGFERDIELAAEYGVSAAVPVFRADRFTRVA
jgi:2-phosphosulfolactate phosphatase